VTELDLARAAYGTNAAPIRTHRNSEHDAFARVTARMRAGTAGPSADFPTLAAALHENRELWTVLAADVADTENRLPPELRAKVFYLAEFVEQHSARILRGKASADVLIEINTVVMKGLRPAGGAT